MFTTMNTCGGHQDERYFHSPWTLHGMSVLWNGLQPFPRGFVQFFPVADTDEEVGWDLCLHAVVCQHCEKPPCMTICPTGARTRSPETNAVVTDEKRCVGCKSCLYACPYNAPVLHPNTKRTMTCDLCNGQPLCTQVCTTRAFHIPGRDPSMERKKAFGQLFLHSIKSN